MSLLKISLILYFVGVLIYYAKGSSLGQFVILFSTFFIAFLSIKKVNLKILFVLFSLFGFFSFFSFFSRSYEYLYSIFILFYGVSSLLVANAFLGLLDKSRFSLLIYFIFISFLWFNFFILGFGNPDLYNEIFNNSSRNVVSAFLILVTILVGASFWVEQNKQPIFIYALTFLSSLILFGRTGIILSFILLVYAFYSNYGKKTFWMILILPFFAYLYFKYYSILFVYLTEETSFKYGLDSPRKIMLHEYLNGIFYKSSDLFLGRRYDECCNLVLLFDNNPHNSFIVGHARYGLFHTVVFLIILLCSIFHIKKKFILVFFVFLIYFRYMFDQLGLFSPLDFVLFYVLMLIFCHSRKDFVR